MLGRTNWDMITTGRASQLVGSVEFPAGEVRSESLESSFRSPLFLSFSAPSHLLIIPSFVALCCLAFVLCCVVLCRVVSFLVLSFLVLA